MNYLAHLYLSCEIDEHIVGNFIADSIRHRELGQYSDTIISGIDLHKSIDTYTDTHPVVKRSTKRLHALHGKYSTLIIDIWYDHLLARNWEIYSNESLREFADRMYKLLQDNIHLMPAKMQRNLPLMAADDWLVRYRSVEGMVLTFDRFKHRLSRPELLANVTDNLLKLDQELEADFKEFFPDLVKHIHSKHHH